MNESAKVELRRIEGLLYLARFFVNFQGLLTYASFSLAYQKVTFLDLENKFDIMAGSDFLVVVLWKENKLLAVAVAQFGEIV